MKPDRRLEAIALLRRHPGWSDRRVAELLDVSHSTVGRWRRREGLPTFTKRVGPRRRRRRANLI
jgi:transcriptional regulator with XRE-family HTH domain